MHTHKVAGGQAGRSGSHVRTFDSVWRLKHVLLVAVASASFAACGSDGNKGGGTVSTTSAAPPTSTPTSTPTTTPTTPTTPTPTPTTSSSPPPAPTAPSMRAFVTSVSGTGNLGSWPDASGQTGLAAGDAICQARARAAGLEPAHGFRAWLSDSSDDAYCRIHGLTGKKAALCGQSTLPVDAGPWVRTDGYPFAPKLVDMLAPRFGVYTPARFDEMGNEIPGTARYFTGTLETGEGQSYFCGDWTIGDGSSVGWSGRTSWTGSVWTGSVPPGGTRPHS